MARRTDLLDDEASLAIRAAWMHYAGGMTQAEVAKRLGVAVVKAHRLIARAVNEGAVKVTIDGDIAECINLENRMKEVFGLDACEVAPDLGEEGLPLRTLAVAGASFLKRQLERGNYSTIGLGHGRTLAATVDRMSRTKTSNVYFVSLIGGVSRNYSATPHDVINLIAQKTNAKAYVLPIPTFANSVEDREVLLNQRGVATIFERAAKAELKFVGIGATGTGASLVSSGMIEDEEIQDVIARGGVGEILGHFFDENGQAVQTTLTDRTLSVGLENPETTRIVAIAGGNEKIGAVRSVLLSGCLSGLITDERTATVLLNTVSSNVTNGRKTNVQKRETAG